MALSPAQQTPNNVNYDFDSTGQPMRPSTNGGADWAQNIANLFYDPRPPVFIKTNANTNLPADFRFWVDLNRNGKFETNGYLPVIASNGRCQMASSNYFNGEPEWIGVLQYPGIPHSATNRYIGRYAYVVLPIGKTLDFNYIHNYSKDVLRGSGIPYSQADAGSVAFDEFVRDQGVGSWELNLAACLWGLNSNIYGYLASLLRSPTITSRRRAQFKTAAMLLTTPIPSSGFGTPATTAVSLSLSLALTFLLHFTRRPTARTALMNTARKVSSRPQAIPAPTLPGPAAIPPEFLQHPGCVRPRQNLAGFCQPPHDWSRTDSYNRYTFQRLLATIGAGSAPELQTYVFDDPPGSGIRTSPTTPVPAPTLLRTKVNLNYDNSLSNCQQPEHLADDPGPVDSRD